METAVHTNFRRLALGLTTAAVALVPMLGVAAKADAAPVPNPAIAAKTVDEGDTVAVKVKLTCPYTQCDYRLSTAPGTAKVDGRAEGRADYLEVAQNFTLRKKRSKVVLFRVQTFKDSLCEPDEYFYVKLSGKWSADGPAAISKSQKETIRRGDCRISIPQPKGPVQLPTTPAAPTTPADPAPATPPATPAPQSPQTTPPTPPAPTPNNTNEFSTGGAQENTVMGGTTMGHCTTDLASGVLGQGGANGFFVNGCTVKLFCPPSATVCKASADSRINLEFYNDQKVTMNSRLRVFSGSNVEYWHRDTSCANTNWCEVEDVVMIRGGEGASVQCNGVRENGSTPNRAKDTCQLTLETQN